MTEKKNNRRILKKIVFGLAGLFVLALIFNAVMFITGVKTNHFHRWAGEQRFGEIVEIDANGFVIKGRNNEKKTILTTEKAVLKKGSKTVKDDLQVGNKVIIFGPENKNGQVDAELIRIFDPNDPKNIIHKFFPPLF